MTTTSLPDFVDSVLTAAWQFMIPGTLVFIQSDPTVTAFEPGAHLNFWAKRLGTWLQAVGLTLHPLALRAHFPVPGIYSHLRFDGGPPDVINATGGVLKPFNVPLPWP